VKLGAKGVEEIIQIKLTAEENAALQKSSSVGCGELVTVARTISNQPPSIFLTNQRFFLRRNTKARVKPAITTSPIAPTANGRRPCLRMSLKLVRRPTPAKVSRNAQRERLASAPTCSLLKK